jgi:hypothetical protein
VLPDSDEPRAIIVGSRGEGPILGPQESKAITVNEDATSLLFLHGTSHMGINQDAYYCLSNFADTAELLGWYEIKYEDGLLITVPLRYGVNIAAISPNSRMIGATDGAPERGPTAPYDAEAIECSGNSGTGARFYAFEWVNPRLGKVITEVQLKGASGFTGPPSEFHGRPCVPAKSKAVIFAAMSILKMRPAPELPPVRSASP